MPSIARYRLALKIWFQRLPMLFTEKSICRATMLCFCVFLSVGMFGNFGNEVEAELIIGTNGSEWLSGTYSTDDILLFEGNDRISARGGDDFIDAGIGDDGWVWRDAPVLRGDNGNDKIFGGPGDDNMAGGEDVDILYGNEGEDMIWMEDFLDREGSDSGIAFGGPGNDTLLGGMGRDNLTGEEGDDVLYGDTYTNNSISSTEEFGSDYLVGGAGNDYIEAGHGNDLLVGGIGADRFRCGSGDDIVQDFNSTAGDVLADVADCEIIRPQI